MVFVTIVLCLLRDNNPLVINNTIIHHKHQTSDKAANIQQ